MNPVDLILAAVGATAFAVKRAVRGSRRAIWAVVVVLAVMSLIPTLAIGTSKRPTDLTFDDVRLQRIPALTSWIRLDGELDEVKTATGPVYHLHAPGDTTHYLVVTSTEPLQAGRQVMTGRMSLGVQGSGVIGFLDADVPAVPRRDEPFQLILLPAALAIVIVVGLRLGYPVIRRERRDMSTGIGPRSLREPLVALWSGRIGGVLVPHAEPFPCTITLTADPILPDVSDLTVMDSSATRMVRLRRGAPANPVRLCRVTGSTPGLEIHAQNADCVLGFSDRDTRARLIAAFV